MARESERISLYGLSQEDALRALLAINPDEPPDDESNPEETDEAPGD